MKCRNPFIRGGMGIPCGQCMPCRVNRRRVWTHRIMLEAMQHGDNTVATLTYSDDNIPRLDDGRGNLVKSDYQNFLKLLRKRYYEFSGRRIRFYCVGEYGDVTERPHFHIILFNHPNCRYGTSRYNKVIRNCCSVCDTVRDIWAKGNIRLDEMSVEAASYVAGYVTKKMTGKDDLRLKGRNPEFGQMSLKPGIGAGAMWEVASSLMQFNLDELSADVPSALRHGKRLLPLGRYLRRKLRSYVGKDEATPESVLAELRAALLPLQEGAQASADATGLKYGDELRRLILEAGDQAVANMEARQRIFKKRGNI